MIPNLTAAECGALLVAVGKHMIDHDVTAEAVLDPVHLTDQDDQREKLVDEIIDAEWTGVLTRERAEEMLQHLTLEEAITFNPAAS